jgi:class 3 adenylate cyclase
VPSTGQERVAERRVCSVLFCDVAGFTPLSGSRDPEAVRELLSRYFGVARTVIGRYGGVVEKFIGDAVMAVWGAPVAAEGDTERAVRAALDLVTAVAELGTEAGVPGLAIRAGVVTGEVAMTLGAIGEGMVAGDAVNTASRVQSMAEPGQVLVDAATQRLAAAGVGFTTAGEHSLKGKAEPVPLWRATRVLSWVGSRQRIDGLEAPLVGRDAELRTVKDLFHATVERGVPRLVLVSGPAGIGKSRLGWEFDKYADGLGLYLVIAERRPESIAYLRESARLAAKVGNSFLQGRALLNLADALLATDAGAAQEEARSAVAQLRRTGARDYLAAISALREMSTPYHLAHGLLDHAEYLSGRGDTEAATQAIDEARGIAEHLGCQPLLDRIAGITPARPHARA